MKKETILGLFALLVISGTIWGYNYLKGKNLLARTQIFYADYQEIGDLMVSAPVKINGFQVGTVTGVDLRKDDMRVIRVAMSVRNDIPVPKTTRAVIEPLGIMGGAGIALEFSKPCQGDGCAQSGDLLQGEMLSLVKKMLDGEQLDTYMTQLQSGLGELVDTLTVMSEDPNSQNLVGQSLYDTREILENTRLTTEELNRMVSRLGRQVGTVLDDLQAVTGTLKSQQDDIANTLQNARTISDQVAEADLGKTITESRATLQTIDGTVAELGSATKELQTVLDRINSGEGTLGKLVNEPDVYQQLERSLTNLDLLLQDVRLHPRRYINVSVFGGKDAGYERPDHDPAFSDPGQ